MLPLYLLFDAVQSSFCAVESSDLLQRFSKRLCFNDVTETAEVKLHELGLL